MQKFQFGRISITLEFPEGFDDRPLPLYIQSFESEILPRVDLNVSFSVSAAPVEDSELLPARLNLPQGCFTRRGNDWHFSANLKRGPYRSDFLATRFVIPSLLFLMEELEVLTVHASAVVRNDRAILIAGRSGSGKSTLARQLVVDGWEFLSDDRVFCWEEDGKWKCLPSFEKPNPFKRWTKQDPESNELQHVRFGARKEGEWFRSTRQINAPFGRSAIIGLVVFPGVDAERESGIESVTTAQATARLQTSGFRDSVELGSLPPSCALTMGQNQDTIPTLIEGEFEHVE